MGLPFALLFGQLTQPGPHVGKVESAGLPHQNERYLAAIGESAQMALGQTQPRCRRLQGQIRLRLSCLCVHARKLQVQTRSFKAKTNVI